MSAFLETLWYKRHPLRFLLWPLSLVYQLVAQVRRWYLVTVVQQSFPVPIIVVGNITSGGVGKTPLVIALVKACQARGLCVGVVSRGYGARIKTYPYQVKASDAASLVGDEPLLIALKTGCPVVISPKRVAAVRYLLENCRCQIIISDDGLQHYAMGRAIEIIVIDGMRGLGNGMCLPAGPLRETAKRLQQADCLVVNGGSWCGAWPMVLTPGMPTHLMTGNTLLPTDLLHPIAAVAAIGNPGRFFNTLMDSDIAHRAYSFPDHYLFTKDDLCFQEASVIMTEKDAVKCRSFAADNWYFLPVEATLSDAFWQALWSHDYLQGCLS